jgi:hypothetical protein
MNDPKQQSIVDQAIKRDANVTPTSFRQALDATAVDFVRRVDARQASQAAVSKPEPIDQVTSRQTQFFAQPVALSPAVPEMQAFPNGASGDDTGGGIWTSVTTCDGTVMEVLARNIVSPP